MFRYLQEPFRLDSVALIETAFATDEHVQCWMNAFRDRQTSLEANKHLQCWITLGVHFSSEGHRKLQKMQCVYKYPVFFFYLFRDGRRGRSCVGRLKQRQIGNGPGLWETPPQADQPSEPAWWSSVQGKEMSMNVLTRYRLSWVSTHTM